jgi:hypothetical protein
MTINLQVGGVYATAERHEYRIEYRTGSGLFISDLGMSFRADGQHYASIKSHYDLITVIFEPDATPEAPAPDMTAPTVRPVKGGVYADRTGREHGPVTIKRHKAWPVRSPEGQEWQGTGHWNLQREPRDIDLIRVISEPHTPVGLTEAPAPDGVTVTPRKKLVVDIHASETATMHAADYCVGIDADGNLKISCHNTAMRVSFDMSPAAARAIGAELIRMGGE